MRNNAFTSLLVGLVVLSVLTTSGLALYYVRCIQRLNRLQFQNAVITRNRALLNSLASESVEYSRRNPSLDPVLQSVGIKARPGTAGSSLGSKP